jgi:tryptophanyl-tRNA synthetase
MSTEAKKRVVSGMRSTGALHLGHLHGVLKNWNNLQNHYNCYFFAADLHCLTTHYDNDLSSLGKTVYENVTDWLACGLDPNRATIFVQSHVPEHSELHLLLSMITPLSWLERVPTYKDQQLKLKDFDLSTYGFLGYPLLQTADVLIYKANYIPVGEDQVAHIEISREIARRFNHIYGIETDFAGKLALSIDKLTKINKNNGQLYLKLSKQFQEQGDHEALLQAQEMIHHQSNLNIIDQERLLGALLGKAKIILPEPEVLLTDIPKFPGLDGQKMSKSYGNTISLREDVTELDKKIRTMPTDPARIRKTDAGNPEKCPVWGLHKIYSNKDTQEWVQDGCTGAKIGCIDCKKPIIAAITQELQPIQSEIARLERDPSYVKDILADGAKKAREVAKITLDEVKAAMGLEYRKTW